MSGPLVPRGHRARDTAGSVEIERICRLPVVELPDDAAVDVVSREVVQAEHFERGFRLRPCQVGALLAWDLYEGLFGPIGVGEGKTYICLLIADRAFARRESVRSMLILPPNLVPQLTRSAIPAARRIFGIRVPIHVLADRGPKGRQALARSGRSGLYVMPYSGLSGRDAEQILQDVAPDLLILDEAHRVKNRSAARTRRLLRYVDKARPRMVALSGTITSKSVMDYHHLIGNALGDSSPLPRSGVLASEWAAVIDASAGESSGSGTGPLTPLLEWARREFPHEDIPRGMPGFRSAFRLRLNTAPGVVASGDTELGTSLLVRNVPPAEECEGLDELRRLEKQVEDLWISPSGDEIEHGMHKWKHLYELSSGFFYRLRWPTAEELERRRSLVRDQAEAFVVAAQEHHAARQEFNRQLRRWIDARGRQGLDTPLLVESDMAHHGARNVGAELYGYWTEARSREFEGMPRRVSEPVRVCPWKVRHVAREALAQHEEALKAGTRPGVLVWYFHDEVGRWLCDELRTLGVDPLWCPADSVRPGSGVRLLDPSNAGRIVVLSMGGHAEGKNLQGEMEHPGFERQVLAQFPRPAPLLEQLLGRTHRQGQKADELCPVTVNASEFDHQNMAACLIDALYIHQTTGTRQKAVYASYDPLPRMYPPDWLRERGFADVAALDERARAELENRFGPLTTPASGR